MPKPTFFQAVLRKPTRSYANAQTASPWADHIEEQEYDEDTQPYSRYDDREDQRFARDEAEDAGPSQPRRRRAKSTVSTVSEAPTTVDPRSTKKKVAVRDETDELDPPVSTQPRRKKRVTMAQNEAPSPDPSSRPTSPAPSAPTKVVARQKSKLKPIGVDMSPSETSAGYSSAIANQTLASQDTHSRLMPNGSSASTRMSSQPSPPVPLHSADAPTRSESRPPVAINQNDYSARPVPPLTPPSSDMSSANSSAASRDRNVKPLTMSSPVASLSAKTEQPIRSHQVISRADEATDDEDGAFRTPRASLDFSAMTLILGDENVDMGTSLTPRPSVSVITPPNSSANRPAPGPLSQPTFSRAQELPVAPFRYDYESPQRSTPSLSSHRKSTATATPTKTDTEPAVTPRKIQDPNRLLSTRLSPSLGAPISSPTPAKPEIRSLPAIRKPGASRSPPSFNFLPPTPFRASFV